MEFSRRRIGLGSHSFLQGTFPTQGLNWGLLHCRQVLYHLSNQGSPLTKTHWHSKDTRMARGNHSKQDYSLSSRKYRWSFSKWGTYFCAKGSSSPCFDHSSCTLSNSPIWRLAASPLRWFLTSFWGFFFFFNLCLLWLFRYLSDITWRSLSNTVPINSQVLWRNSGTAPQNGILIIWSKDTWTKQVLICLKTNPPKRTQLPLIPSQEFFTQQGRFILIIEEAGSYHHTQTNDHNFHLFDFFFFFAFVVVLKSFTLP